MGSTADKAGDTMNTIDLLKAANHWKGDTMTTPQISEQEETRRGELLAEILHLKRSKTECGRYLTVWGTKTALGIYRTVERIVLDGE